MLPASPKAWNDVTQGGQALEAAEAQSAGLPDAPLSIESVFRERVNPTLSTSIITRGLVHRCFGDRTQLNGGCNSDFAASSDVCDLTMGDFNHPSSAMYSLTREFVLADEFIQGAFDGSYPNHQYLACGCAPEYPDAANCPASRGVAATVNTMQPEWRPSREEWKSALCRSKPGQHVAGANRAKHR